MIDESMAVGTSVDEPDLRWFGYLAGGLGVFVAWNVSTLAGALLVPGMLPTAPGSSDVGRVLTA